MSKQLVESLESRVCMSVSGISLANYTVGTVLNYDTTSGGQATTGFSYTTVGPKMVRHTPTIAYLGHTSGTDGTSDSASYIVNSPTIGQALYRTETINKAFTGGGKTDTVSTYSNPKISTLYPATMVAGTTYTYTNTLNNTAVSNGGSPTTTSYATTFSVKLRSERSTRITAAGHVFHCYVFDKVTIFKISGQTQTISETDYIAPGIGLIKQATASVVSTAPKQKTVNTAVLSSFTLA